MIRHLYHLPMTSQGSSVRSDLQDQGIVNRFPTASTHPFHPDRKAVRTARTVRSFSAGVVIHSTVSINTDRE